MNDSDLVKEQFSGAVRDWPSPPFAQRVLYLPVSSDPEATKRWMSVLSDAELRRSDGFLTEEGRVLFIQRRAFRRYCGALATGSQCRLSQVIFEETANGRPYLRDRPDIWLSFSSCRLGFIGAWSLTHAIGIDVEDPVIEIEEAELAQTYFTESEIQAVEKGSAACRQTFLQLWCLKEAALKSIGEGLPFGLDSFEFEVNGDLRIVNAPDAHGGPARFSAHLFDRPGVCAALVARNPGGQEPQYAIRDRHSCAANSSLC